MATARAVPLLTYDDLDFIPQERAGTATSCSTGSWS